VLDGRGVIDSVALCERLNNAETEFEVEVQIETEGVCVRDIIPETLKVRVDRSLPEFIKDAEPEGEPPPLGETD